MIINKQRVGIIDYGMSNINSVVRACKKNTPTVLVLDRPEQLIDITHLIIPGVGSFSSAMNNLNKAGWPECIRSYVRSANPAILGICLGMQLFADIGIEGGECRGIGLIPGKVLKIPSENGIRLPHVGWNEIQLNGKHPGTRAIFENIESGTDFYFVHSYHFVPDNSEHVLTTTIYGREFVSSVMDLRIIGTQFHPEKSSKAGQILINNFLRM